MIGDGINDILALKRSDLGVAMGAGTKAAQIVAGLVLENNDFGLLPIVLREGRVIEHNLRRAAKLFLLKNVYTLVLIIVGLGILDLAFPYLPQQVTLLNALTIGGPALLIMLGRSAPARRSRMGFARDVGLFVLSSGLSVAAIGLVVWMRTVDSGDGVRIERTVLLSTLILIGLGNVIIVAGREWRFVAWVAVAIPIYATAMYVPFLADFFVLVPLTMARWSAVAIASVVALVPGVLAEAYAMTRRI
jgi:magnesium-transporting ATPase (P-type)